MKYSDLEISILHTFASDVDLFAPCENYAFENIWQTKVNQSIFKIIKDNHVQKAKTDLHLLKNGLLKLGYSKDDIKLTLQSFNSSDNTIKQNIKKHMEIVFDVYRKREIQPTLKATWNELYSNNGDIDENVGKLQDKFNELDSIKNNLSSEKSILDVFDEAYKEIEDAFHGEKEIIGYATGLRDLDNITCGLKQEVIVIGAPPGAGKTSLMVTIADNVAVKEDAPINIFSLEMPAVQLMKNLIANDLEINSHAIRSGRVTKEELDRIKNFRNKLNKNLAIDDTSGITWQYIETKIRKRRRDIPLDQVIVVMIDYLQLMRNSPDETKGLSREEQMTARCNGLQELSKKYNLCIIELSQLTKESSKEKRAPTVADLKESGAIEANAVIIILLFRPDYYEKEPKDPITGECLKGLCELNVAKNRYGETKATYVRFIGQNSAFRNRFENPSDEFNSSRDGNVF